MTTADDTDVRVPDEAAAAETPAVAPTRRGFLGGLATALAAVAVVRTAQTPSDRPAEPVPGQLPRWIGHF